MNTTNPHPLFTDKELSWLSFNERVLQEAQDESVPLVERLRFLGIFSSNLDEFFRVRVADVKRRILLNEQNQDATRLLSDIQERILEQQESFGKTYKHILSGLKKYHINLIEETDLLDYQKSWLEDFFHNKVKPLITPIFLNENTPFHRLDEEDTYLAVELKNEHTVYILLNIPTDELGRFIVIPPKKSKRLKTIILLENIIRLFLKELFAQHIHYDQAQAYAVKLTRDAELDVSAEISRSFLDKVSHGLEQRLTAKPVRLIYDREMPKLMSDYLVQVMGFSSYDSLIPGGRYHNFKDFISFPNLGPKYLEFRPTHLVPLPFLDRNSYLSPILQHRDLLFYYPYHSFDCFTEWLRQSAYDPNVTTIKISIYRVAGRSRVIQSLLDAAMNGKNVTVVVELQARFDEEANVQWAQTLTASGVKVVFGDPTLKIHSKLCLICYKTQEKNYSIAHVGTGNFHEKTARIYTDFSLLTSDPQITEEVDNVFEFIEHSYKRFDFKHLWVSPFNTRNSLCELIDQEIATAREGQRAELQFKLNNLDDHAMIMKLYEASQAGVKIRLNIRGMCSLIPGVKGLSDNIEVISIVGRYLEHARCYVFYNGGEHKVYIASADLMTRNLNYRVEVACPIYDATLKKYILDILRLQNLDRKKARIIDKENSNQYALRGNRKKLDSQMATYKHVEQWYTENKQESP